MPWDDWIPAITTSGIVSVVGLISGVAVKAMIERRVQSGFDVKLEGVRAAFRKDEEVLRADLRARDAQFDALRGSALGAMRSRHEGLDKRRLEASERLWAAVVERAHLKALCLFAQALNMEKMVEVAGKGGPDTEKTKQLAEVISKFANLENMKNYQRIYTERPFVSPVVWALFSAYDQVLIYTALQFTMIRGGVEATLLKEPKAIVEMVKKALPHQAGFIDQYGPSSINFLVEELEEKLLKNLVESMEGKEADDMSVTQAGEILKLAEKAAAQQVPPMNIPAAVRA